MAERFSALELLPPDLVARSKGALLAVLPPENGLPSGAMAATRVEVSPKNVWAVVSKPTSLGAGIPMVDKVEYTDAQVSIRLRFRLSLLSVRFGFEGTLDVEEGRSVEIRWLRGEPRGVLLRFDVAETPRDDTSVLYVTTRFEIASLGWLVRVFLNHHPEIAVGVHPGSALAVLDAICQASQKARE